MTQTKRPFFNCILFLAFCRIGDCFAQEFVNVRPVSKDVVKINTIYYKKRFLKSGWRSNYFFENGNLTRQLNFFKNELRMDEHYSYYDNKNSIKVTKNHNNQNGFSITKTYFDSLNRILKSELYFSKDTINPEILRDNFIYSNTGKLISYKSIHIKTKHSDCLVYNYENEQLKEELLYIDCQKLIEKTTLRYNKYGNPVFEEIDHQDPNSVITGARSEKGIQRFFYVFDKRGNWTKRYFVTSKGRKILEIKRKIIYRT